MPSSSWPTTSRPPCAPPTRWAGGRTARRAGPRATCATRPASPSTAAPVNIGGRSYTLAPTAFPLTNDRQTHYMHGLSVKSNTQGRVGLGGGREPVRLRQGPAARAHRRAAAGGRRRRRHAAGPGRHRLEHAGRQGHLAAAGRGRRAHRRLRHRPRCVQAAHPEEQRAGQLAGRPGRATPSSAMSAAARETLQRLGAGQLGLRAEMEGRARPALRALAGQGRLHRHGDQLRRPTPRAANRMCRPRPRWPTS